MPTIPPLVLLGAAAVAVTAVIVFVRLRERRLRNKLRASADALGYQPLAAPPVWLTAAARPGLPETGASGLVATNVFSKASEDGAMRVVATVHYLVGGASRRHALRRVIAVDVISGKTPQAQVHPERDDLPRAYESFMKQTFPTVQSD
ncbi:MAG: hypothetical protein AAGI46_00060 [Planctomycetota bacterium]